MRSSILVILWRSLKFLAVNDLDSIEVSDVASISLSNGCGIRNLHLDLLGLHTLPECIGIRRAKRSMIVAPSAVIISSGILSVPQIHFNIPLIAEIAVFSVAGRLQDSSGKKQFHTGVYSEIKRAPKGVLLVVVKNQVGVIASQRIIM